MAPIKIGDSSPHSKRTTSIIYKDSQITTHVIYPNLQYETENTSLMTPCNVPPCTYAYFLCFFCRFFCGNILFFCHPKNHFPKNLAAFTSTEHTIRV